MSTSFVQSAFQQPAAGSTRTSKAPQKALSSSKASRRILVAVDFGTTYSAAAWLQIRAGSKEVPTITAITSWPYNANTMEKVPTVLQYSDRGSMKWGFGCDRDQDVFQWFKLEQDPKYKAGQLAEAYPDHTLKPENEKEVKDLITKYLRFLRRHVEKSVKETLDPGGGGQSVLLRDTRWEYIITVPAMWPESAQSITEKCANDAGMAPNRPVKIIAEPEAAGIHALRTMFRELELKEGQTFVICDAGGGTVDLISYRITKLGAQPELEEAAPGTGGLCGSSFLDREFYKWVKTHMSGCQPWMEDDGYMQDAMTKWESEIKRNFNGIDDGRCLVPCRRIDDDEHLNIKNGSLKISCERMKEIFSPVIKDILKLVKGQIEEVQKQQKLQGQEAKINAVLLAGGFGRNEYLRDRIQAAVGQNVTVKKMEDCTTAIVKGALVRGLQDKHSPTTGMPTVTVASRMARKHYGTKALQKFSPDIHDHNQTRYPGGVDGGERVDVMRWFNARVKDLQPMPFHFYYDQLVADADWNGRLDTIKLPIYACEIDDAPGHPDPANAPIKINKRLVEVKANLDLIPKKKLKKEKGADDLMYYKIDFHIVMISNMANVTFKLVHDGTEYGTVDAEWDTTEHGYS
ncbi:hypothetical protein INS49_012370 [Diaporthe citri]|uniref:uncharacterized protein n=1 Tax=Diaporthe citri TaxID=83186 RepID=UPI001C81FD18|nr:uncharacterized protein INS49_012370 [Diaporthe citri]KAG6358851.1 hypothetical protein INS49_012370 [Diaporthe citri]